MKIVVTGGTGFIGRRMVHELLSRGDEVVILSRDARSLVQAVPASAKIVRWGGSTLGEWVGHLNSAHAIVNLAGEPIGDKRWSKAQKQRIMNSRVHSTRALIEAIGVLRNPPTVLVNASAVGYYGPVEQGDVVETHPRGRGFLAEVCEKWEAEARRAEVHAVRVVLLRLGVVLAEDGGALERLLLPFRLFAGGHLGSGEQWFPWVHRDDVVGAALHAIDNPRLAGPVNVAAPEPVTMKQFCSAVGQVLGRPSWLNVPAFMVRLLLGEMAEMVLTGQRQRPAALMSAGYVFRYPELRPALRQILGR